MRVFRPLSKGVVLTAGAVGAVGVAGAAVAAVHFLGTSSGRTTPTAAGASAPPPAVVSIVGMRHGKVPWDKPIRVRVVNGSLQSVELSAGSATLDGNLSSDDTLWTSATTLVPTASYHADIAYVDGEQKTHHRNVAFAAADTDKHLRVILSPGDGDKVGVGSPIIARFSRSVPINQRANVEARLSVVTTPAVVGAWHWMNSQEIHWRPPTYWKPGTRIQVSSSLDNYYVGDGVWGTGSHSTSFVIGPSHISRVDVAAHKMYVYNNGALIKTFPISAGRTKYPTKNGVHITFEKSQVVTMDSATVGIPRNSPDGYYEKVYWDVRISYGGAFVHAAPWSVRDQGLVNVSHGCVNISTANATWFYYWSLHGDIVDVYNSSAPADTADPGMADWNISWAKWLAGDASPSADALAENPKMPRDYEPGATASPSPARQTYSPKPSPSPTRSASPKPTSSPTPSPSPTHH